MKILTRYIIKEAAFGTMMAFLVLTFFLVMNSLFVLSDLVIMYGVGLFTVIKLLAFLLPSTVAITVPMAFLIGVLLTYSRLVQDNEYNGMQAGGISAVQIAVPAVLLGIFVTFLSILFNNYTLPAANLEYKKLHYEIVKKRSSVIIKPHSFIKDFENYVFYVGDRDARADTLRNILIFVKSNRPDEAVRLITAREGELLSDENTMRLALKLKDGFLSSAYYGSLDKMNFMSFGTNFIDLDVKSAMRMKTEQRDFKGTREMTAEELYAEIKSGENRHDNNWLNVEFHKKFSIPFACLAFAFVGIPLGLMTKKGGKITGISFSLALIFIYYILLNVGQYRGYKGEMDHFFAVWMANFVLIGIGVLLMGFRIAPAMIKSVLSNKRKNK